jgi:hypothetical protein
MSGSDAARSSPRFGPALRHILLLAPIIFVAHFLEEAPGFVAWFNRHVARGITPELFWTVNYSALAITVLVVALEWVSESPLSAAIAVAWLSLLMLANALFHIAGTLADGAYMPGVLTALLLYLPFYGWVLARIVRTRRLPAGAVVAAALAGAAPMLIHGYLIVFRGSRLF